MRLLLAEDEPMLSDALTASLGRAGFDVEVAANSAVAEYLLLRHPFDVVVLDLGLPMVDGLTVVRRVRAVKPALPVMVLTALDGLDDRVAGLNAGADDYLTKPFDFPELEARLRALLRRSRVGGSALLDAGALAVDRDARRVTLHGEALDLSPREWQLLELLLTPRDKVVTKDQIVQAWGGDGTGDAGSGANSIEVYIHRLRRKLDQSGLAIRTVRGLGYLLETAPA